jgi:RimJ/RimL family protein N-acetyltransferase
MRLDCHAANEAAIRLYENLGYHTRGYFMTKRLPSASPELCG